MSQSQKLNDLLNRGALDEALALAAEPAAHKWERNSFCRLLSQALIAANRDAQALPLLDEVDRLLPKQMWVAQMRAILAQRAGDAPMRLHYLALAFGLEPANGDLARDYAAALAEAGRGAEADAARREHRDHVEFAHDRLMRWQEPGRRVDDEGQEARATRLYLDLLERTVANTIYGDAPNQMGNLLPYDEQARAVGRDIPSQAHTMIGLRRLRHLRVVAETAIRERVRGDFVETGVWRGGACILLAGVLRALGVTDRRIVVADSFAGLPPPDARFPQDAHSRFDFHLRPELAIGVDEVRHNFERYDLLDEHVAFLQGFFRDTLPMYPYGDIAVLRMDGDMYSSTMDTLVHLYPRVASGGWIICDDYGVVLDARRAVLNFRAQHDISTPMVAVDGDAVFWRREG